MAKIETKTIVLTFSKLVKDHDKASFTLNADLAKTLEDVAQEMCGDGVVVETEIVNE